MKKILVFGSNGLVGSSLQTVAKNNNYKNYLFEFSTRSDTNLFSYKETFHKINSIKPDIVINSAGKVGGINANNTKRTEFMLENLKINMNIYESLTMFENIKIINIGSSCIYPLDAENPIKESSLMGGKLEDTNSAYAMAKLTAIELGSSIKKEFGHEVINLIPTNLYGPYDRFSEYDSHVIPGLIYRMIEAKKTNQTNFKIWGSGNPLREFLYAEDLALAMLFILNENLNDEILNIGSGLEVSIKDLATKIKEVVSYKGSLVFDTSMPDGKSRKLIDSSKIFGYGWKPKTDLDLGLKNTYNFYLKNYL